MLSVERAHEGKKEKVIVLESSCNNHFSNFYIKLTSSKENTVEFKHFF